MGFGMGMMGGGGFSLIIWMTIILGVIYYFNKNTYSNSGSDYNSNSNQSTDNKAVKIAKERYAKGEITKKELNNILKDLR